MELKEFKQYLTDKEYNQFIENYNAKFSKRIVHSEEVFTYIENCTDFERCIDRCFDWENSPQGYSYWIQIKSRTEKINIKTQELYKIF